MPGFDRTHDTSVPGRAAMVLATASMVLIMVCVVSRFAVPSIRASDKTTAISVCTVTVTHLSLAAPAAQLEEWRDLLFPVSCLGCRMANIVLISGRSSEEVLLNCWALPV